MYHVYDLLKRFRSAPVGLQILSLGDCHGHLTAADESTFRQLFDRISAAYVGEEIRDCTAVSDIILRCQLSLHSSLTTVAQCELIAVS